MLGHLQQAMVGVDHLLEVQWSFDYMRKGVVFIKRSIVSGQGVLCGGACHVYRGKDPPGKITSDRHEMYRLQLRLELAQALANLGQVLMGKGLVDRHVIVAPSKVRGSTGSLARAGRARDCMDVHVLLDQLLSRQRQ